MDPRYAGETLKHLEKQNELLMDAYNSMSNDLHKLQLTSQVEEEMLMRKFYQFMAARGLPKKKEGDTNTRDGGQVGDSTVLLTNNSNDSISGGENRESTALVPTTSNEQQ